MGGNKITTKKDSLKFAAMVMCVPFLLIYMSIWLCDGVCAVGREGKRPGGFMVLKYMWLPCVGGAWTPPRFLSSSGCCGPSLEQKTVKAQNPEQSLG